MKIKDLIELLNYYDPDMEIVIKPQNSFYVENVKYITDDTSNISSFWDDDFEAFVIKCEQVGSL